MVYVQHVGVYGDGSGSRKAAGRPCRPWPPPFSPEIPAWDTGSATRGFLYAEDEAEGIVLAAERYESGRGPGDLDPGPGRSHRPAEGFTGRIVWDATKPDGQPRRMLDTSRAATLFGFVAKTSFEEGLGQTIAWYRESRGPGG